MESIKWEFNIFKLNVTYTESKALIIGYSDKTGWKELIRI